MPLTYIILEYVGVSEVFPGPYLCFYDDPTPQAVQNAVDMIMEVIKEDGPFDIILGFSNGAALAATVIAAATEKDPLSSPFKAAILICPTMPFRLDSGPLRITSNSADTVIAVRNDYDERANRTYDWLSDPETAGIMDEFEKKKSRLDYSDLNKLPRTVDLLLRYHPSVHRRIIHIPTVHVIGDEDEYMQQGHTFAELCDPKLRKVITHTGGHHFPREKSAITRTCQAIEWAVDNIMFSSY
jgi:acetyl esterase/lipase